MSGNLLSIGKSGLYAAQTALTTTGHNITNANVEGYSRQGVVQATSTTMEHGYGFVGTGTKIAEIKRYSDEFLNTQVRTATASTSSLDAYYAQVSQIDNLLADTTSGLSPAIQNFFSAVQDVTGNGASIPSRQALLSSSETLAGSFQQIDARLEEIGEGVNSQVQTNVNLINTYAKQIAEINSKIGSYGSIEGRKPNDLLDQRDQLVMELNKHVKATVTAGSNNAMNVSIGNGQPLVVGQQAFQLATMKTPTDQTRLTVGYVTGDRVTQLPESALAGGELGGIMEFRTQTLDRVQNSIGRLALGMAMSFNDQHKLGIDGAGKQGKDYFVAAPAFVSAAIDNNGAATVGAVVKDVTKLTDSDYKVESDGTSFFVTRLSDNNRTKIDPYNAAGTTQTIDGVAFSIAGAAASGDNYLVRPTAGGAANFQLAISDVSEIAAGMPVATSAPLANKGSGQISAGSVSAGFFTAPPTLPVTLSFDAAGGGQLTGFPAGATITMTQNGSTSTYTGSAPFKAGASYSFAGVNVTMSGAPANGDSFSISANTAGTADTRNIQALGALQTKNIFNGASATYQSAFAQTVSAVGNKTREVQVNASAGEALLKQVQGAASDVSGVNLDEEATNLLKYQQAYQAAGKVMQIANTIFDTLLSIAR
ncbi:flagellar hook-associated protein FlgK [Massilia sp. Dwa41.01b]|uniref:flagellar hook-associated protein FlgK n=1 Tax=unclassified Massilia TaxID=2609279 RepID=UPI001600D2FD|nr:MULTISPECIES: flagellar hook-associated protein FlgK [unclassified Massilia]QNA90089.1 flagellar hook-associated protein FlgK [Massilia sp. Dwa41.01b]QNB00979.1 flagellar hook-associated protein FlgK [Massilia sp. Se16.2.3]